MAEDLLYHLDGDSLREEQGCADVTEVMEAYVRKARTPEERLEAPGHEVGRIEGRALRSHEDEI